jgi:hypothetical protein
MKEMVKKRRGKKAKYLVYAERGLLEDNKWRRSLKNCPTELLCRVRRELARRVPGLNEKFNRRCCYFGYWSRDGEDRLYLFVQKKRLSILLRISRDFEKAIHKNGFEVHFINNFQGRAGWLTGFRVLHDTKNVNTVMKWLLKAFE